MKTLKISNKSRALRLTLPVFVLFALVFTVSSRSMDAQAALAASAIGDKSVESSQNGECDEATIALLPQPRYIGLWRPGAGQESWQTFDSWNSLVTAHQGMGPPATLVDIETHVENGSRSYAAVWQTSGAASDELTNEVSLGALEASLAAKELAGLGLIEVEMVPEGAAAQALAIWRPGAPAVELVQANSVAAFENGAAAKAPTHYLIDLEVWREGDEPRFLGIFRPRLETDGDQIIKLAQTWCVFHEDYHALASHRLEDLELDIDAQGNRLYSAFWSPGTGEDHLWIGYSREGEKGFDKACQNLAGDSPTLRLVDLEILDEDSNLQAGSGSDRRQGRLGKRLRRARANEGPRRTRRSTSAGAPGSLTNGNGGPVINGAPVLHDTGSSGPD